MDTIVLFSPTSALNWNSILIQLGVEIKKIRKKIRKKYVNEANSLSKREFVSVIYEWINEI